MAIELPHYLEEILNFLGFGWPEIDEDEVRRGADLVRRYARDTVATIEAQHSIITEKVPATYSSGAYETLALHWASHTRKHLDELVTCCGVLADGLELAADGIELMKGKVIVQLAIAAEEFVADQAAAVATLGVAEAALPVLYAVQNRLLALIVNEFESEVVEHLMNGVLAPVRARVEAAAAQLVYEEAATVMTGGDTLTVDTAELRRHAATLRQHADGIERGGADFRRQVEQLRLER